MNASMRKTALIYLCLSVFFVILIVATFIPLSAETAPPTTLEIPSLEIETTIVPINIRAFPDGSLTWDTSRLTTQVGYLQGTAWFGEGSNIVLGGHSELANHIPSVFHELHTMQAGDDIFVRDQGDELHYVVTRVFEVDPADLSILYPSDQEVLTLITCDLDSFTGYEYDRRIVIVAERQ